jgi:protein involved in polysaccharide export with SLBB domain
MNVSIKSNILWLFSLLIIIQTLWAQESQRYLLGEEPKLQIVVYVLGEVSKPGEYLVADNTDVVKLIAKAGGTTDFSNISQVTITRTNRSYAPDSPTPRVEKSLIKFDMNKYLSNPNSEPPPVLQPGDVVYVKRNTWHKWRSAFTVIRDLSVVASAYFLYLRSKN